jgi:hypothetical protein
MEKMIFDVRYPQQRCCDLLFGVVGADDAPTLPALADEVIE